MFSEICHLCLNAFGGELRCIEGKLQYHTTTSFFVIFMVGQLLVNLEIFFAFYIGVVFGYFHGRVVVLDRTYVFLSPPGCLVYVWYVLCKKTVRMLEALEKNADVLLSLKRV